MTQLEDDFDDQLSYNSHEFNPKLENDNLWEVFEDQLLAVRNIISDTMGNHRKQFASEYLERNISTIVKLITGLIYDGYLNNSKNLVLLVCDRIDSRDVILESTRLAISQTIAEKKRADKRKKVAEEKKHRAIMAKKEEEEIKRLKTLMDKAESEAKQLNLKMAEILIGDMPDVIDELSKCDRWILPSEAIREYRIRKKQMRDQREFMNSVLKVRGFKPVLLDDVYSILSYAEVVRKAAGLSIREMEEIQEESKFITMDIGLDLDQTPHKSKKVMISDYKSLKVTMNPGIYCGLCGLKAVADCLICGIDLCRNHEPHELNCHAVRMKELNSKTTFDNLSPDSLERLIKLDELDKMREQGNVNNSNVSAVEITSDNDEAEYDD